MKHRIKKRSRKVWLWAIAPLLGVFLFVYAFTSLGTTLLSSLGLQKQSERVASKAKSPAPKKKQQPKKKAKLVSEISPPKSLTLNAVGDIMFDRRVSQMINQEGGGWPFAGTSDLLADADLTFANLENPISSRGTRLAVKDVTLRGNPAALSGMTDAGIDIVSLANNHIFDYGLEAYQDTVSALDQIGVRYAGAGTNIESAFNPTIIDTTNSTKVGFLAYSEIVPSWFVPADSKHGIASARLDPELVEDKIAEVKKSTDFIIVSIHWGREYDYKLLREQNALAHRLIDQGADIVLGHHPQVVQEIEIYRGKLIAYSLGNFVFDSQQPKTAETVMLRTQIDEAGLETLEIVPIVISSAGQPTFADDQQGINILTRLTNQSPSLRSASLEGNRLIWTRPQKM